MNVLAKIEARLGRLGPESAAGWCEATCPFDKHRGRPFAISLKAWRYRCLSCNKGGTLEDLGLGPRQRGLVPPLRALPPSSIPPATDRPWRPITPLGDMTRLEEKALEYLATRGIGRVHASVMGLGYGISGRWVGRVIHPYFDDAGMLVGWQGRLTGEPETEESKTLFAKPGEIPGGHRMTVKDGALYLLERVTQGETVLLVEGPYDALAARKVIPCTVALFGSSLHTAQLNRILRRRPSHVILGLDPDKAKEQMQIARRIYRSVRDLSIVVYPEDFTGDWAAYGDGQPRDERSVQVLLQGKIRFSPGM